MIDLNCTKRERNDNATHLGLRAISTFMSRASKGPRKVTGSGEMGRYSSLKHKHMIVMVNFVLKNYLLINMFVVVRISPTRPNIAPLRYNFSNNTQIVGKIMEECSDKGDSSLGEEFNSSVQLGFLDETDACFDKNWSEWDGGKVGGRPMWLNPMDLPLQNELKCKICDDPMNFLLQVIISPSFQLSE